MSLSTRRSFVKVALYQSGDFQVRHIDCRLPVTPREDGQMKKGRGIRGKMTALSPTSSKNCLTAFRSAAHLFNVEICLTYPVELQPDLTGPVVKEHLHRFIKWMLHHYGKDTVYAWVLEFQKNHSPHFHLLVDRFIPKDDVSAAWYKIVGSGLEKHLRSSTRVDAIRSKIGMADYMARYLHKMDQKMVPPMFKDVGRFWGIKRGIVKPTVEITLSYSDADSAFRALREVRKARKASLRRFGTKKGTPIKWKWGGSGFTDRSMGYALASALIDRLEGEVVSNA